MLPREEQSAKKSVVHIEALLADPDTLEFDVGEVVDLSGPEFSTTTREKLRSSSALVTQYSDTNLRISPGLASSRLCRKG